MKLKLILVDPVEEVCDAWTQNFEGLPNVKIVNGLFEHLQDFDCMVSAANSFGLMDGGVDLAIIQFFGFELMDRVQERILTDYLGEQPVGASFIIETGHAKHPFLAHTPTMRIPMRITRTDNVYRAMWAMLLAVRQYNLSSKRPMIQTIACPGLGTATGEMPADEAARQMATAYRHFLEPPTLISWPYASTRHNAVGYGGDPGA
jgi:O-acetyl-ADP-ribose deacetylase (regulator of RNase III)